MRALEKRLAFLQKQASVKPKTLGLVRAKINDLTNDLPGVGSFILPLLSFLFPFHIY